MKRNSLPGSVLLAAFTSDVMIKDFSAFSFFKIIIEESARPYHPGIIYNSWS